MSVGRTARFRVWMVDGLLVGGIGVLLVVALGALATGLPTIWCRCVEVLDARNWSHWTWTGVGGALTACLLLMRTWYGRK